MTRLSHENLQLKQQQEGQARIRANFKKTWAAIRAVGIKVAERFLRILVACLTLLARALLAALGCGTILPSTLLGATAVEDRPLRTVEALIHTG